VTTTGDGMVTTFDSAIRAVRAAAAIHRAAEASGIQVRAGVHTGEVESVPGNLRGLTVHMAARIAAAGQPGETLVSPIVREMASSADIAFEDRGAHALKGISGARQLFAVHVVDGPSR
jgi:class 3 adenylate cyclase